MIYGNHLDMLCPISGINWNNGSIAGVWSVNLNNNRTNSNTNVGVRADSTAPRTQQREGGDEGGGFRPCAKSAAISLSGSNDERQRGRTL